MGVRRPPEWGTESKHNLERDVDVSLLSGTEVSVPKTLGWPSAFYGPPSSLSEVSCDTVGLSRRDTTNVTVEEDSGTVTVGARSRKWSN